MPQMQIYPDGAARQKAYRTRLAAKRAEELQAKGLPPAALIPSMPSRRRWHGLAEQARIALQTLQEELQAYWDDRSEGWQESDRGEQMSEDIGQLEDLAGDVAAIAAHYSSEERRR